MIELLNHCNQPAWFDQVALPEWSITVGQIGCHDGLVAVLMFGCHLCLDPKIQVISQVAIVLFLRTVILSCQNDYGLIGHIWLPLSYVYGDIWLPWYGGFLADRFCFCKVQFLWWYTVAMHGLVVMEINLSNSLSPIHTWSGVLHCGRLPWVAALSQK